MSFAAANKNRPETKFVVLEDAERSNTPVGIHIALYHDYEFKTIELPTAPLMLQVTVVAKDSAMLSWQPPAFGSLSFKCYEVAYNELGVKHSRTKQSNETFILVDGLEPSKEYRFGFELLRSSVEFLGTKAYGNIFVSFD